MQVFIFTQDDYNLKIQNIDTLDLETFKSVCAMHAFVTLILGCDPLYFIYIV